MPGTFRRASVLAVVDFEAPRFVADAMVGKLARWLRVLGVDVVYDPSLDDHELVALARKEKRILLTRDQPLASSSEDPPRLFIESADFREQLRQVVECCQIDRKRGLFTRCVECNGVLELASREEVQEKVPPYVFSTHKEFKRCPRCSRIVWGGTHRQNMQRELDAIFT